MSDVIDFYNTNAKKLSETYESLIFEEVYGESTEFLPPACPALDIGAGSGRDAAWLNNRGYNVTAIEPAKEFRLLALALHPGKITWVDDNLPSLKSQNGKEAYFGLVLLSGVWMHIPPKQRGESFERISQLIANEGILIITLRHGPLDKRRKMFVAPKEEIFKHADKYGLKIIDLIASQDKLNRTKVRWETVVLQKLKSQKIETHN